jgi:hypothetical protein
MTIRVNCCLYSYIAKSGQGRRVCDFLGAGSGGPLPTGPQTGQRVPARTWPVQSIPKKIAIIALEKKKKKRRVHWQRFGFLKGGLGDERRLVQGPAFGQALNEALTGAMNHWRDRTREDYASSEPASQADMSDRLDFKRTMPSAKDNFKAQETFRFHLYQ